MDENKTKKYINWDLHRVTILYIEYCVESVNSRCHRTTLEFTVAFYQEWVNDTHTLSQKYLISEKNNRSGWSGCNKSTLCCLLFTFAVHSKQYTFRCICSNRNRLGFYAAIKIILGQRVEIQYINWPEWYVYFLFFSVFPLLRIPHQCV